MKIHDCEQGTAAWFALRVGIPTASNFEKIVTPLGKLSAQSRRYAFYLVTERLLNRTLESLQNLEWVERGREMEPEAVRAYELEMEQATRKVGFVTTDDGQIGASPDRLIIGANGGLEVKCPAAHTHVEYLVDGFGKDYRVQVQGQMLVAELDFVDRWSFHPEMPPVRIRTYRDEPFIRLLRESLDGFLEERDAILEQVRGRGYFAERAAVLTPAEAELGAMMAEGRA